MRGTSHLEATLRGKSRRPQGDRLRKWGRRLNQVLGLGYVSESQAATYPRVGDIRETMRITRLEDGMYKPGLGKSSVKMFKSLNLLAEE